MNRTTRTAPHAWIPKPYDTFALAMLFLCGGLVCAALSMWIFAAVFIAFAVVVLAILLTA